MTLRLLVSLATVPMLCACASLDPRAEPQEEKELITGSHVLERYRSESNVLGMSKEEVEDLLQRLSRPPNKPVDH